MEKTKAKTRIKNHKPLSKEEKVDVAQMAQDVSMEAKAGFVVVATHEEFIPDTGIFATRTRMYAHNTSYQKVVETFFEHIIGDVDLEDIVTSFLKVQQRNNNKNEHGKK